MCRVSVHSLMRYGARNWERWTYTHTAAARIVAMPLRASNGHRSDSSHDVIADDEISSHAARNTCMKSMSYNASDEFSSLMTGFRQYCCGAPFILVNEFNELRLPVTWHAHCMYVGATEYIGPNHAEPDERSLTSLVREIVHSPIGPCEYRT